MYRREEEKIKSGFDSVAPDLFQEIRQREYKKIESEEELFGELELQEVQNEQKKNVLAFHPTIAMGSIAAVILCFLMCTQLLAPRAQATKIMIDVNSGMQFMVTEKEQVTEVTALNADSKKITEAVSGNQSLEEAVYEILENLNQYEYFRESDAGMLVSYVNQKKDDSKEKVSSVIREYFQKQNLQVPLVQQDVEEKTKLQKKADQQGVSLGKYCFLKKLQDEYQINTEKMYQQGMGDILQEIDQKGIDFSDDKEIDYSPGKQTKIQEEEAEATREPEDNSSKIFNNKKETKKSKVVSNKTAEKKASGEKKTKNKKTSGVPESQKTENGREGEADEAQKAIPVTAEPTPVETPVPKTPVEEKTIVPDSIGTSTMEPVATSPTEQAQEDGKDKKDDKKDADPKKEVPFSQQSSGEDYDWGQPGKDQPLDWNVDDVKEQIKEYMKSHQSKKDSEKEEKVVDKR